MALCFKEGLDPPIRFSKEPFSVKRETLRSLRELAYYSSLGFQVALSIFIGLALGVYLDKRLGTPPYLMFLCLGLGIAAGFRNIGLAIRKSRKL